MFDFDSFIPWGPRNDFFAKIFQLFETRTMIVEKMALRRFAPSDRFEISSWDLSANDLLFWGNVTDANKDLGQRISEWHTDKEIQAFVLESDSKVVGYGEIWEAPQEIELARLLINPEARGKGFGKVLLRELVHRAKSFERKIWLRVHPDNVYAKSMYLQNGFKVAANDLQKEFNRHQKVQFLCMEAGIELI